MACDLGKPVFLKRSINSLALLSAHCAYLRKVRALIGDQEHGSVAFLSAYESSGEIVQSEN